MCCMKLLFVSSCRCLSLVRRPSASKPKQALLRQQQRQRTGRRAKQRSSSRQQRHGRRERNGRTKRDAAGQTGGGPARSRTRREGDGQSSVCVCVVSVALDLWLSAPRLRRDAAKREAPRRSQPTDSPPQHAHAHTQRARRTRTGTRRESKAAATEGRRSSVRVRPPCSPPVRRVRTGQAPLLLSVVPNSHRGGDDTTATRRQRRAHETGDAAVYRSVCVASSSPLPPSPPSPFRCRCACLVLKPFFERPRKCSVPFLCSGSRAFRG
jgi:hypothetical protein